MWRPTVEMTPNGVRAVIPGMIPYAPKLHITNKTIVDRLHTVQPFIHAMLEGIHFRILPDEDEQVGLVGIEWQRADFSAVKEEVWFPEHSTPLYYLRTIAEKPNPLTYILTGEGSNTHFQPVGWVMRASWREIYSFVEAGTGGGTLPALYYQDGTLKRPSFYVQAPN